MNLQTVKQRFGIVGNSEPLNRAIGVAVRVAPTDLSCLVMGESGVGKESFSQIIHQLSSRKHSPFIAVNCGAIPEGTIDSELFGHEKGAFTGAADKRKGYFETVNGGTIFLDEIGEMPVGTQARLLRVLESGEFIKVGSSQVQKTDVRVVAATNVNLLENVKQGKFREDLYYRLSTVPIEVPPLRERGQDILLLFKKFALDFAEKNNSGLLILSEDAEQLLLKLPWPGNVRQLKNVSEQVSVLAVNKIITATDFAEIVPDLVKPSLPSLYNGMGEGNETNFSERELLYKALFELRNDFNELKSHIMNVSANGELSEGAMEYAKQQFNKPKDTFSDFSQTTDLLPASSDNNPIIINQDHQYQNAETVHEQKTIADMEKEIIIKALQRYRGKRRKAAEELGISERTLYRKIKEYDIQE